MTETNNECNFDITRLFYYFSSVYTYLRTWFPICLTIFCLYFSPTYLHGFQFVYHFFAFISSPMYLRTWWFPSSSPIGGPTFFLLLLHETGKPEAMKINLVCNYLFLMETRNNNGSPITFEFFDVIHLLPLSLFICHFHFSRSQTYLTLTKYIKYNINIYNT
jgi:hypothetical protein